MKCYCGDVEHEMCYDNIIGMYDDACSCCKETSQDNEAVTSFDKESDVLTQHYIRHIIIARYQ